MYKLTYKIVKFKKKIDITNYKIQIYSINESSLT